MDLIEKQREKASIRDFEALRLTSYLSNGEPTIGWGHKILEGEDFSKGTTEQEASRLFDKDFSLAQEGVTRLVKSKNLKNVDQETSAILTNMVYNMGVGGVSEFKDMFTAINKGDYNAAADAIHDSLYMRTHKDRALALANRFRSNATNSVRPFNGRSEEFGLKDEIAGEIRSNKGYGATDFLGDVKDIFLKTPSEIVDKAGEIAEFPLKFATKRIDALGEELGGFIEKLVNPSKIAEGRPWEVKGDKEKVVEDTLAKVLDWNLTGPVAAILKPAAIKAFGKEARPIIQGLKDVTESLDMMDRIKDLLRQEGITPAREVLLENLRKEAQVEFSNKLAELPNGVTERLRKFARNVNTKSYDVGRTAEFTRKTIENYKGFVKGITQTPQEILDAVDDIGVVSRKGVSGSMTFRTKRVGFNITNPDLESAIDTAGHEFLHAADIKTLMKRDPIIKQMIETGQGVSPEVKTAIEIRAYTFGPGFDKLVSELPKGERVGLEQYKKVYLESLKEVERFWGKDLSKYTMEDVLAYYGRGKETELVKKLKSEDLSLTQIDKIKNKGDLGNDLKEFAEEVGVTAKDVVMTDTISLTTSQKRVIELRRQYDELVAVNAPDSSFEHLYRGSGEKIKPKKETWKQRADREITAAAVKAEYYAGKEKGESSLKGFAEEAARLGIKYDGPWSDTMGAFTDPVTKGSFSVMVGEKVEDKYKVMLSKFKKGK